MTRIGTVDPVEAALWTGRDWRPVVDVLDEQAKTIDDLTTELETLSGDPDQADKVLSKVSADERKTILAWITNSSGLLLIVVFIFGMLVSGWLVAERNFNVYSTVLDGSSPTSIVVVDADSTLPGAADQTTTSTAPATTVPASSVPTAQPENSLPSGTSVDDTEFLPAESSAQTLPSTP